MPQADLILEKNEWPDPKSAEGFCRLLWDGDNGAGTWEELVDACKKRDAQRDRDTLTKAAERVEAKRLRVTAATYSDAIDEAISSVLAPLNEKEVPR